MPFVRLTVWLFGGVLPLDDVPVPLSRSRILPELTQLTQWDNGLRLTTLTNHG